MVVILPAAAILGYAAGILLLALLGAAALRRRLWALFTALSTLEILYLLAAITRFQQLALRAGLESSSEGLLRAGHYASTAAAATMLFTCLQWAGQTRALSAFVSLAGAAAPLFVPWPALALGACGVLSAAGCAQAWRRTSSEVERRFYRLFGIALIVPPLVPGLQADPGSLALSYFPAIAILFRQTLIENVFGLRIRRHLLFMIVLGTVSAVYLTLIRLLANTLAFTYDAFGSVIETTLILAACVLWLPLIAWMTRVIGRRTALYPEFGKRVIEEAVSILEPEKRAAFLANGIKRIFRLRSVYLSLAGGQGAGKPDNAAVPPAEALAAAERLLDKSGEDCMHRLAAGDPAWAEVFGAVPYNYILPLRYENRLIGVLWIDSNPKQYIDEGEPVLRDLCRQMSHSLEACRLVEEKLRLERSLAAQEHLAALGNVAAAIAHEVKNPLSSIRALAQLMSEDTAYAAKYGRDLGYVIAETDRLNASVRQLLAFARPPDEPLADVDFSMLVSGIVQTVQRETAGSAVSVRSAIASGLVVHNAGSQCLQQIVWNLLLNAVQATGGGGEVEVTAEADGERQIRLSITDDGPGVPPALRARIFQPYFTTRQKGTGLGLYIVQKNVQDLAGSIEVQSPVAEGRGARFCVVLPGEVWRPPG